jgi:hypothetical protein
MVRRRGELTKPQIDRDFPHQIVIRADHYSGSNYRTVQYFCVGLSLAPRNHSVVIDDRWHVVFCFSDKADGEKFKSRFGGEWFSPARRGRGHRWQVVRDAQTRKNQRTARQND